jgi:hypothetical protein
MGKSGAESRRKKPKRTREERKKGGKILREEGKRRDEDIEDKWRVRRAEGG